MFSTNFLVGNLYELWKLKKNKLLLESILEMFIENMLRSSTILTNEERKILVSVIESRKTRPVLQICLFDGVWPEVFYSKSVPWIGFYFRETYYNWDWDMKQSSELTEKRAEAEKNDTKTTQKWSRKGHMVSKGCSVNVSMWENWSRVQKYSEISKDHNGSLRKTSIITKFQTKNATISYSWN